MMLSFIAWLFVIPLISSAPMPTYRKGFLNVAQDYKGRQVVEIKYEEYPSNATINNRDIADQPSTESEDAQLICGPIGVYELCCPNYKFEYAGTYETICIKKCKLDREFCSLDVVEECYKSKHRPKRLGDICKRQTEYGLKRLLI